MRAFTDYERDQSTFYLQFLMSYTRKRQIPQLEWKKYSVWPLSKINYTIKMYLHMFSMVWSFCRLCRKKTNIKNCGRISIWNQTYIQRWNFLESKAMILYRINIYKWNFFCRINKKKEKKWINEFVFKRRFCLLKSIVVEWKACYTPTILWNIFIHII